MNDHRACHEELVNTGVTIKSLEAAFEDLDSDCSGTITYNEFIEVHHHLHTLLFKPVLISLFISGW